MYPRGRYKVVRELGQQGGGINGGIAVVRDRVTGKLYIEKRFRQEDVYDGHAQREIEYLQSVQSCPEIVSIYDFYFDARRLSAGIIQEFCRYGSLSKVIGKHMASGIAIDERFIWSMFYQLARAVRFCHFGPSGAHGRWNAVIHHDIKPDNVFLQRVRDADPAGWKLKLGDFGSAISMSDVHRGIAHPEYASRCTPLFAPPELPLYSDKSDIYMIGSTMACLCLVSPIPSGFTQAVTQGNYGIYTQELVRLVYQCRLSDSAQRPSSAELVEMIRSAWMHVVRRVPEGGQTFYQDEGPQYGWI